MGDALSRIVTLFDRRKGYGEHTMDRRRTYVDIMERVLGSELLSQQARQRSRFVREVAFPVTGFSSAVTAVEVRILDSIKDERIAPIVELKHVRSTRTSTTCPPLPPRHTANRPAHK
jgi:hypothetical protein